MSHSPQRKETNCLNCGTEVIGRYCHVCGQENIEPKETFWGLVNHAFQDLTHWDGKFFITIKYIITKPGFLTKEFMNGRRAAYLHPVKLYIFTSAIFFIIFFSITDVSKSIKGETTREQFEKLDSAQIARIMKGMGKKPMTREAIIRQLDSNAGIHFTSGHYNTRVAYDSVLRSGKKDHNWFQRQLVYKEIALNKKYNGDEKLIMTAILNKFLHVIPQMMFVLLPLFALALKLLYIRRKKYYYVDHIIFSLHFYVFIFLTFLVIVGINQLEKLTGWDFLSYFTLILSLGIFFYFYKALRNFYQQRRAKTILKYTLLLIILLVLVSVLFILFFFLSMFQV